MTYRYYVNGEKFTTDDPNDMPLYEISSPDENTPAFEDLESSHKVWCEKDYIWHRLTGPAVIWPNEKYSFCLNNKIYDNVHDWLKDHPIQDNAFQVEMILKWS
jgi:hypothetical protein